MALLSWLANALTFMAEPAFAIPWFAVAVLGAAWMIYDAKTANSALNPPLKAAWPIIIIFFSALGILLYLVTSRPTDIARFQGEEKMKRFTEFSKPRWRKVVASAIHCVGGDGLGIMTAMIAALLLGFSFWQEFWFEYLVGYFCGWFIFQTWAMRIMNNDWLMAIWKGGRAEFFSMITVMIGMGVTMRFVTSSVVAAQPPPGTWSFWTFGALGLIVGFILTYPMNYWLVTIGWKHGQGHEHMLKKMAKQREADREQRRPGFQAQGLQQPAPAQRAHR